METEIAPPEEARTTETKPEGSRPPRRIVLFSDGTGNSSASLFKTNVWRLYNALDVSSEDQLAFYDDGVGTSSFRPLAILGGVFGYGLARNVRDLYAFLCRHHRPDDEIYMFGFSRGAFTIRVLTGVVASQGIITNFDDEADLRRQVARAYQDYRRQYVVDSFMWVFGLLFRALRDLFLDTYDRLWGYARYGRPVHLREREAKAGRDMTPEEAIRAVGNRPVEIAFLGLWDTVDAYGLPIDEMTRAWDDYIWPLSMRDRDLRPLVKRARQALALDDERNTFHPLLWNESREPTREAPLPDRRIVQVWFSGMHSDVGGGYPIDTLAHVSLVWMIDEIDRSRNGNFGLTFIPQRIALYRKDADPLGPMHDSRQGLGSYYRYQPRRFPMLARKPAPSLTRATGALLRRAGEAIKRTAPGDAPAEAASVPGEAPAKKASVPGETPAGAVPPELASPIIHHAVFDRIAAGVENYAPFVLPPGAQVLLADGTLAPDANAYCRNLGLEPASAQAEHRSQIDNWVWLRRVIYFVTLSVTLLFAFMPFYADTENTGGIDRTRENLLSEIPQMLGGFLPGIMRPWVDAWAANPMMFTGFALAIILLSWLGSVLRRSINARSGTMWRPKEKPSYHGFHPQFVDSTVRRLREAEGYKTFFRWLKGAGAPFFFFVVFVGLAVGLGGRVWFALYMKPAATLDEARKLGIPAFCVAPQGLRPVAAGAPLVIEHPFDARCKYWGSGASLEGGRRYRITLTLLPTATREIGDTLCCGFPWQPGKGVTVSEGAEGVGHFWWDAEYRADLFGLTELDHPPGIGGTLSYLGQALRRHASYAPGLLIRRNFVQPWFTLHARFGDEGRAEVPLMPLIPPGAAAAQRRQLVSEFTAGRTGPLYLFVNDALDMPFSDFYANNHGKARVSIEALGFDAAFNK